MYTINMQNITKDFGLYVLALNGNVFDAITNVVRYGCKIPSREIRDILAGLKEALDMPPHATDVSDPAAVCGAFAQEVMKSEDTECAEDFLLVVESIMKVPEDPLLNDAAQYMNSGYIDANKDLIEMRKEEREKQLQLKETSDRLAKLQLEMAELDAKKKNLEKTVKTVHFNESM